MSDLDFYFFVGSIIALVVVVAVGELTNPILRRRRKP